MPKSAQKVLLNVSQNHSLKECLNYFQRASVSVGWSGDLLSPPHITRDTTQPQNFVIVTMPPCRSTTRLTTKQQTLHAFPEAFKAWKDGWVDATHQDVSSTLLFEDEFQEKFIAPILEEMYKAITQSLTNVMGSRGIEINSGSALRFLIQPAIPKLVDYTTQQLIQSGHSGTLEIEIYEFIAMKHLCSTFHVSNNVAWSQMKLIAVANGFSLLDQNRYGAIISSL